MKLSERTAHLIGKVDETVRTPECPFCGENLWDFSAYTYAIPRTAPNPKRSGLEVLPYICKRCGYVRLHAAQTLEAESSHDAS